MKLKKRVAALAFVVGLIASFFVASSQESASASGCNGWVCGTLIHDGNDGGYNPGILVSCNFNGTSFLDAHYVHVGQSSKQYCGDIDGVYVNAGARVLCYYYTWPGYGGCGLDSTGWHKVGNDFNFTVVYQLD